MATNKPATAAGYDADRTLTCERALVTLLRGFGSLKHTLRLIGGLVPRYLTPEQLPDVPAHAGTSDVDIVLNLQILAENEVYKSLARQLKHRGFTRFIDKDGVAARWRWQYQVSEHEVVVVEFLRDADDALPSGRVAAINGEKISALAIKHAGIAHDWFEEKEITAELLDGGGVATEIVRFADLTAFVVLKALAYEDRVENKDAADLVHVIRYAGPLEYVAQHIVDRRKAGRHVTAIDSAMDVLRRRFCDGDNIDGYKRDGPIACARFKYSGHPDFENERVREQRDVAGMMTELLRIVSSQTA